MWPSEVTFTRTPRSTHLPDAHARRVASPGSATAGEGEEEDDDDDDGRRSSATESDHDDPYSPKAGEAGEAEISAELDANEYEDRQSTWVRVTAPLSPSTIATNRRAGREWTLGLGTLKAGRQARYHARGKRAHDHGEPR